MYNPLSLTSLGYPPTKAKFDRGATFVRSHLVSPFTLAAIRSLIALYCWVTIIVAYAWLSHNFAPDTLRDINLPVYNLILGKWFIAKSFSFFTFITYWSLAIYFTISAWHTFTYACNQRTKSGKLSHLHDSFPRCLQLAHSLWYTTITTYPFLVTIAFWCSIYAGPWPTSSLFTQWSNVSVHGLNSLFAISEIVFSAVSPPPFVPHLLVVCIGLSLYLGVAYITKATEGIYVYEWLNPVFGWQQIVAHVAVYAGGMIAIYSLVWVAVWVRERLVKNRTTTHANAAEYWSASEPSDEESIKSKEMKVSVHEV